MMHSTIVSDHLIHHLATAVLHASDSINNVMGAEGRSEAQPAQRCACRPGRGRRPEPKKAWCWIDCGLSGRCRTSLIGHFDFSQTSTRRRLTGAESLTVRGWRRLEGWRGIRSPEEHSARWRGQGMAGLKTAPLGVPFSFPPPPHKSPLLARGRILFSAFLCFALLCSAFASSRSLRQACGCLPSVKEQAKGEK